jgi:23S rRNA (guanosine2251-2'-O)-methyltransferase
VYIFGRNPVAEALAANNGAESSVEKIFVQFGAEGSSIDALRSKAQKRGIPVAVMDKHKFSTLEREVTGGQSTAQGVIALVAAVKTLTISALIDQAFSVEDEPLLVALDGISDPHNLGAIARSAECAAVMGMIVPESKSAPLSGAAMKTSAGALEHLPVARVPHLAKALQDCKSAGFRLVGLDSSGARPYTEAVYDEATVIVVGNEGRGISHTIRQLCDEVIAIPLSGTIPSLNASVAAALVMFEARRQRSEHSAEYSERSDHL